MSADLYPVPEKFAATARIRHDDYERLYADSLRDPDAFWGEEWLQELHEGLASALIALAGFHALAAIVMSRIERTNLVAAMITGIKVRRR